MAESCNIQSADRALGGGAARGWAHIGVLLKIEAGVTQIRLSENPPDLLIRPDLAQINYLDFNKGEELIRLGYKAGIQSIEKDDLKVEN